MAEVGRDLSKSCGPTHYASRDNQSRTMSRCLYKMSKEGGTTIDSLLSIFTLYTLGQKGHFLPYLSSKGCWPYGAASGWMFAQTWGMRKRWNEKDNQKLWEIATTVLAIKILINKSGFPQSCSTQKVLALHGHCPHTLVIPAACCHWFGESTVRTSCLEESKHPSNGKRRWQCKLISTSL